MAKLYLKFEQAVLKEVTLAQGVVTIGRLPDNLIQIDNPAVSGHHAKIYWESDHYVAEDNHSLNGTFVNNQRISKATLNDGDNVTIGKHTISFKDEWHEGPVQAVTQAEAPVMPPVPKMEATMVLDTKKAREMMAAAAAAKAGAAAPAGAAAEAGGTTVAPAPVPPPPAKERVGVLAVMSGKTDESRYVLTGKLSVIGKSDMASIKLKGWFAPKVAAAINRRDNKYFIAASEKSQRVKVNGVEITGQKELADGDMIEVANVKMTFSYSD